MRNKENLCELMNINYLHLTNKTLCVGKYNLPSLYCSVEEYPDYIALYSQPCEYHKTKNTAVSFFDYDIRFNGRNGLYTAIYYNDSKLLDQFKLRFKGIRYFISPDYSMIGDGQLYHNVCNYGMSREVALWLQMELGAIVIPNIPCSSMRDLEYITDGIENVSIVAFSTKGRTENPVDVNLIRLSLTVVLKNLSKLKAILVYDTSINNDLVNRLFAPAKEMGIDVIIPGNSLKNRNIIRSISNV